MCRSRFLASKFGPPTFLVPSEALNTLDFSPYNARHSCIVKCRERLAIFSSEVELVLLCRVKFDQS